MAERVGFYTGFVEMSADELGLVRSPQVLFFCHLEKQQILLRNLSGLQYLNTAL